MSTQPAIETHLIGKQPEPRDPIEDMIPLLEALGEAWAKHPYMRLSQLIMNVFRDFQMENGTVIWEGYIEDDDLLEVLKRYPY